MLHSVSIKNIMPLGIRIWYCDHLKGGGGGTFTLHQRSRVGHMLAMAPCFEK